MRSGRRALVVSALLAVTLLSPAAARAEQELPIYPKHVHTRIGNDLVINGAYYRIAYFTSRDSMKMIGEHFLKQWKTEGYPTVVEGDGKNELIVSAIYTREGLQRAVVIREHAGKRLAFVALKDLWTQAPKKKGPAFVELPGSVFNSDVTSVNEGAGATTRTSVIVSPFQQTLRMIEDALLAKKFEPVRAYGGRSPDGNMQKTMEFSGGGKQVMFHVSHLEDDLTAVQQTVIESALPDGMPRGGPGAQPAP